jgi:hypothetical protein
MKDLGVAKQILGMRIIRDRANSTLKISQTEYVKKILNRFSMDGAKSVNTPLGSHFRITKDQSPKTDQETTYMNKVPYASTIGSLMYAMVCTRPDIAHALRVVSRYIDVVFCLPKYINNKITTRNSTNPYRIGLC